MERATTVEAWKSKEKGQKVVQFHAVQLHKDWTSFKIVMWDSIRMVALL